MLEVLELRAYSRAKQAVDRAKKMDEIDGTDPMVQRVMEIQADLLYESGRFTFGRKPQEPGD